MPDQQTIKKKLTDLVPDQRNANRGTERGLRMLDDSLREDGAGRGILLDRNNNVIAGNKTLERAVDLGFQEVIIVPTDGKQIIATQRIDVDIDSVQGRRMALRDNRVGQVDLDFDPDVLRELADEGVDLAALWNEEELAELVGDDAGQSEASQTPEQARKTLAERFIIPPFSVLDARQGYWQSRKQAWIALGIQSELGRGAVVARTAIRSYESREWVVDHNISGNAGGLTGTSLFDPVLCELAYRWFCPKNARVLDPFAGGSVRGIVANYLGYHYTGIDLRPEQIAANEVQAKAIIPDNLPRWITGDSRNLKTLSPDPCDFIFSCPPYFDLEIYSDDTNDLSNAGDYAAFMDVYCTIIKQAVDLLADNRFACFVVGDIRDKRGLYRNFPSDTIAAFQDAGAMLYNEAILVTAVGSLPIRVAKQFAGYRKLGKTHQNVLVFFKGDPKTIKSFGEVEADYSMFEDSNDA